MIDRKMESEETYNQLSLDITIPRCALNRRFGISFCSTSSYFVEPRLEGQVRDTFFHETYRVYSKYSKHQSVVTKVLVRDIQFRHPDSENGIENYVALHVFDRYETLLCVASSLENLDKLQNQALRLIKRRGAVSFPNNDTNAVYIRMLGDVKMRPITKCEKKVKLLSESDQTMLDKLGPVTSHKRKFRSRLMSLTRLHHQHHSDTQLPPEVQLFVDDFYSSSSALLLNHIGDWNFNIFCLDTLSGGRPLYQVAYHLFQNYQLIPIFHLELLRLLHFISLVEENYHKGNPYHNAIHAADVTQSMHCYLQETKMAQATSNLEKMAALVAALTHDLDHPGVNNTFLIVTSNPLAELYQNKSVLENHHWRCAVGLLIESGLLNHFPSHQREHFFQLLKSLILATDITRQQEFLLKFSVCFPPNSNKPKTLQSKFEKKLKIERYIESGEFQYSRNDEHDEHRLFVLQIALKCADISNPCRPWDISQRWSRKICQEFFLQGDTERALNVAVTPLCDRLCNTVPNIQHGFMQHVVNPLFKAWDKFLGTELSSLMIQNLNYNQAQWKSLMVQDEEMVDSVDDVVVLDQRTPSPNDQPSPQVTTHLETDEDSDGRSEEADVVKNDVNLLYHYQNENKQSDIYLCSLSSHCGQEPSILGAPRRYSFPHVVCKDLSYYLGLRKDTDAADNHFLRRQSLPSTAVYFRPGLSALSISPSLSLDTLLGRPKVTSLSPGLEADVHEFISLQQPTLMLHAGELTRFTSRRASCDPVLVDPARKNGHLPSDYLFTPLKHPLTQKHSTIVGLASSWPNISSSHSVKLVSNSLNPKVDPDNLTFLQRHQ